MASISTNLASPPLLLHHTKALFRTVPKFSVSPHRGASPLPFEIKVNDDGTIAAPFLRILKERKHYVSIVVKAIGEGSESSTPLSIVKSVQNVWDKSEDRLALVGLGFAAIVALWASVNLISAVDKLPLIPSALELVGILYSSWFIYRYLLFKPDREELFQIIKKSVSDVLGQ